MTELTDKQKRFVEEYLIDLNATQAAIRAGYSANSAMEQGWQLLQKTSVSQAISEAQAARSARTEIEADRVLRELAKIGFSDIRNVIRWRANVTQLVQDEDTGEERLAVTNEVQLMDSADISSDAAACISEISQTDKGALKVKLYDKRAALVDIGRHLGMFIDRGEIKHVISHEDALEGLE